MRLGEQLETTLEERIEELRHRLRIEAAVVDGAKNVIRTLQSTKTIDKKALQEVSRRLVFFIRSMEICNSLFNKIANKSRRPSIFSKFAIHKCEFSFHISRTFNFSLSHNICLSSKRKKERRE